MDELKKVLTHLNKFLQKYKTRHLLLQFLIGGLSDIKFLTKVLLDKILPVSCPT